jgi:hypothetical protein
MCRQRLTDDALMAPAGTTPQMWCGAAPHAIPLRCAELACCGPAPRPAQSWTPARSGQDVSLGGRASLPVTFDAPVTDKPVYLDLQVSKPGDGTLYRDANTVFQDQ